MKENLKKYNEKRNFKKTKEPIGKKERSKKLRFVVQHHMAKKDHYDFRLENSGLLLSWAVPKGPSYNPSDKRLAVHVENHPLSYGNFEGIIPKGEYGGGVVMLWDRGTYKEIEKFKDTYKKGYLKFTLQGTKLKGDWTLVNMKDDNWLLIKERDNVRVYEDINDVNISVKTNKTMEEIEGKDEKVKITHPDKILYKVKKITKKDVINYYEKVSQKMLPYIRNRILSTVRSPEGVDKETFFKKHFQDNSNLSKIKNEDYYYIEDKKGLLSEVQMNSIEFHVGGATINDKLHPNVMVFDLDPHEGLSLDRVRQGVKDLKKILDKLELKSYLKTSGGKGYHIVVPMKEKLTWKKFGSIAEDISKLLEEIYPEKYTTNMRLENRKEKIFIDYFRNKKTATSIAPYSLRARENASISMPIKWSELDKIKPDEITIEIALKRLKRKDPWEGFFSN